MKSVHIVAAALLLPAGLALAQPPAGGGRDDWRARHEQDAAQRRQEETHDLSVVLGLTPAQQPALATWLAAMHPPAELRRERPDGDDDRTTTTTTPQKLADKQARLSEMQQFKAARLAATRTFYAALDNRQQQVFDALDRLRHDARGPHHAGHGAGGPDMAHPQPGG